MALKRIPEKHFVEFYDRLVGTPERVTRLESFLTRGVRASPARPYDGLANGARDAIVTANSTIPPLLWIRSKRAEELRSVATVGIMSGAAAFKALGAAYVREAMFPQRQSTILKSLAYTARHVMRASHMRAEGARQAFAADSIGAAFDDPRVDEERRHYGHDVVLDMSADAFVVRSDNDGQLVITPKERHPLNSNDVSCPANRQRVTTPEGSQLGMYVLLRSMGHVATESIYPQRFDVIQDPH